MVSHPLAFPIISTASSAAAHAPMKSHPIPFINAIGAKVLIDVVMYFLTFVIQRRILFKKEERAKCD